MNVVVEQLRAGVVRTLDALTERGAVLPADLAAWRAEQFIDVPDGVMVAFYPSPVLARRLAIDGGEPPEDLHITLALPGKLSELTRQLRRRLPVIVRGFAMISRPLSGTINGLTEFQAHNGKKPVVYLIDVPGLSGWRQRLVEILALNGYTVANDHGFVPHMTLKYAAPDETISPNMPEVNFEFDSVCLIMAGKRKEYKLGGNPDVDEALDSFSFEPFAARPPNTAAHAAAEKYKRDLEDAYNEWAGDAAAKLAAERDATKREALLAVLLALLLLRLKALAHTELANAILQAMGTGTPTPAMYTKLSAIMAENDTILEDSLIPDVRTSIEALFGTLNAQSLSVAELMAAFAKALAKYKSRAGQYAGAWWRMYNWAVGMSVDDQRLTVAAHLDPQAHHCGECPLYHAEGGVHYDNFDQYLATTGGRVPGEFECGGNCRCWLEFGPPDEPITGLISSPVNI